MNNLQLYKGKTILVTGATGLVGSNLVERLVSVDDCHVIAMGRNLSRLREAFASFSDNKQLTLLEHDVCQGIPEGLGVIDYIFNTAGPIGGQAIMNTPVDVITSNVDGSKNCLDYIKKQRDCGVVRGKVIVFSSVTVSNATKGSRSITEQMSKETDCLDDPISAYTQTKRMVEVMAKAYCRQYSVPVVILRLSYVYGYSHFMPQTAVFSFLRNVVNGQAIELTNPNQNKRDNIYVEDAIDNILLLAAMGINGESYNVSSAGEKGNYASMLDFANEIISIWNDNNPNIKVGLRTVEPLVNHEGFVYSNIKARMLGGV